MVKFSPNHKYTYRSVFKINQIYTVLADPVYDQNELLQFTKLLSILRCCHYGMAFLHGVIIRNFIPTNRVTNLGCNRFLFFLLHNANAFGSKPAWRDNLYRVPAIAACLVNNPLGTAVSSTDGCHHAFYHSGNN